MPMVPPDPSVCSRASDVPRLLFAQAVSANMAATISNTGKVMRFIDIRPHRTMPQIHEHQQQ